MSLLHYPGEEFKLGRKKLGEREERKGEFVLPVPASAVPFPAWDTRDELRDDAAGWSHRWLPQHQLPSEHRLRPGTPAAPAAVRGWAALRLGAGLQPPAFPAVIFCKTCVAIIIWLTAAGPIH